MRDDDKQEPELAALQGLPREIAASRVLEERTVRALRARGLLRTPAGARRPAWTWAAAAALALGIFAAGYLAGRSNPSGSPTPGKAGAVPANDDLAANRSVEVANDTTSPQRNDQTRYVVWF
jgi:hypothetical protein